MDEKEPEQEKDTKKPSRMKVVIDRRDGSSQVVRMDPRGRNNRDSGFAVVGMPRGTTIGTAEEVRGSRRGAGDGLARRVTVENDVRVEDLT